MRSELVNLYRKKKLSEEILYYIATFFLVLLSFAYKNYRIILYTFEFMYIIIIGFRIRKSINILTNYVLWSIFFFLICLISCIYAKDQSIAFKQTFNVLKILLIANSIIFFVNNDQKKLDFILFSIIISAIYLSVLLIANTNISQWGTTRIGDSISLNSNDLGLNMAIATIIALYFGKKSKLIRYFFLTLIFSIITFMSGSRKAFFLIIFGFFLLSTLTLKRKERLVIALPLILLTIYISWNIIMNIPEFYNVLGIRIKGMTNFFSGQGNVDDSTLVRIQMIDRGIELFKKKPILGYGIANYSVVSPFSTYSHNNYVELLVGVGIIGTIVYYSIYIYIIFNLLRFKKKDKSLSLFFALVLGIVVMEYGLVSYYIEIYQIIIASAFSAINISQNT